MLKCCRPLGVEVFKIADPAGLKNWQPPEPASYRGMHGITLPTFDEKTRAK